MALRKYLFLLWFFFNFISKVKILVGIFRCLKIITLYESRVDFIGICFSFYVKLMRNI